MANKAAHYWNGTTWTQLPNAGLTEADITIRYANVNIVANNFHSVKDSKDNIYISCFPINNQDTGQDGNYGKIIKISKDGTKSIAYVNQWYKAYTNENQGDMVLSKDESRLYVQNIGGNGYREICYLNVADITNGATVATSAFLNTSTVMNKFAIYQDLYIWVASGTTVKIYDYTTRQELASRTVTNTTGAIVCDKENNLYRIEFYLAGDYRAKINKLTFDGISTISSPTDITGSIGLYNYEKQLIIDKCGDLIILTNSDTASTLLKYTTTGTAF